MRWTKKPIAVFLILIVINMHIVFAQSLSPIKTAPSASEGGYFCKNDKDCPTGTYCSGKKDHFMNDRCCPYNSEYDYSEDLCIQVCVDQDLDNSGVFCAEGKDCRELSKLTTNECLFNKDCDDEDQERSAINSEICGDGIDNDCDDKVDEAECINKTYDSHQLYLQENMYDEETYKRCKRYFLLVNRENPCDDCGGIFNGCDEKRCSSLGEDCVYHGSWLLLGLRGKCLHDIEIDENELAKCFDVLHCFDGVFQPQMGEQRLDCGGSCLPCEDKFEISIEDSAPYITVYKQPGDIVSLRIYSPEDTTIRLDYRALDEYGEELSYFQLEPLDGCEKGREINISQGVNYCKFQIPTWAAPYYSFEVNDQEVQLDIIKDPLYIILTNKLNLFDHCSVSPRILESQNFKFLEKLYFTAEENRGIVYDINDYIETESWNSWDVHNLQEKLKKFIKQKVGVDDEHYPHVLFVGGDSVIPFYRYTDFLENSGGVSFKSDSAYSPKCKQVTSMHTGDVFSVNDILIVLPDSGIDKNHEDVKKIQKALYLKFGHFYCSCGDYYLDVLDSLQNQPDGSEQRESLKDYLGEIFSDETDYNETDYDRIREMLNPYSAELFLAPWEYSTNKDVPLSEEDAKVIKNTCRIYFEEASCPSLVDFLKQQKILKQMNDRYPVEQMNAIVDSIVDNMEEYVFREGNKEYLDMGKVFLKTLNYYYDDNIPFSDQELYAYINIIPFVPLSPGIDVVSATKHLIIYHIFGLEPNGQPKRFPIGNGNINSPEDIKLYYASEIQRNFEGLLENKNAIIIGNKDNNFLFTEFDAAYDEPVITIDRNEYSKEGYHLFVNLPRNNITKAAKFLVPFINGGFWLCVPRDSHAVILIDLTLVGIGLMTGADFIADIYGVATECDKLFRETKVCEENKFESFFWCSLNVVALSIPFVTGAHLISSAIKSGKNAKRLTQGFTRAIEHSDELISIISKSDSLKDVIKSADDLEDGFSKFGKLLGKARESGVINYDDTNKILYSLVDMADNVAGNSDEVAEFWGRIAKIGKTWDDKSVGLLKQVGHIDNVVRGRMFIKKVDDMLTIARQTGKYDETVELLTLGASKLDSLTNLPKIGHRVFDAPDIADPIIREGKRIESFLEYQKGLGSISKLEKAEGAARVIFEFGAPGARFSDEIADELIRGVKLFSDGSVAESFIKNINKFGLEKNAIKKIRLVPASVFSTTSDGARITTKQSRNIIEIAATSPMELDDLKFKQLMGSNFIPHEIAHAKVRETFGSLNRAINNLPTFESYKYKIRSEWFEEFLANRLVERTLDVDDLKKFKNGEKILLEDLDVGANVGNSFLNNFNYIDFDYLGFIKSEVNQFGGDKTTKLLNQFDQGIKNGISDYLIKTRGFTQSQVEDTIVLIKNHIDDVANEFEKNADELIDKGIRSTGETDALYSKAIQKAVDIADEFGELETVTVNLRQMLKSELSLSDEVISSLSDEQVRAIVRLQKIIGKDPTLRIIDESWDVLVTVNKIIDKVPRASSDLAEDIAFVLEHHSREIDNILKNSENVENIGQDAFEFMARRRILKENKGSKVFTKDIFIKKVDSDGKLHFIGRGEEFDNVITEKLANNNLKIIGFVEVKAGTSNGVIGKLVEQMERRKSLLNDVKKDLSNKKYYLAKDSTNKIIEANEIDEIASKRIINKNSYGVVVDDVPNFEEGKNIYKAGYTKDQLTQTFENLKNLKSLE